MPTAHLHLVKRGARYWWRRRLPASLRQAVGRSHVSRSLLTADPVTGRRRARRLSVAFDEWTATTEKNMLDGQPAPTPAELNGVIRDLFNNILDDGERERAKRPKGPPPWALEELPEEADDDQRWAEAWVATPFLRAELWQDDLEVHDYDRAAEMLGPILAARGIRLPPDSEAFRVLCRRAMRVAIRALIIDAERELGTYREDDELVPEEPAFTRERSSGGRQATGEAAAVSAAAEPPISSFIEKFAAQARDEGQWTNQTEAQNRNSIDLLLRILGDKAPSAYSRADAERLRRTLEKIPSNFGKSPRHFEIAIEQVIAERKPDTTTLSEGTLDRHWNTVTSFFRWINRQDGIGGIDIDRIFGGFRWAPTVPGAEERAIWDDDALHRLFESPIWTGCDPHPDKRHWRHEPGDAIIEDEYFWLPILALYTGARCDELASLTAADIETIDGVGVIRFHGEHLKTASSERYTPIHSMLRRLGFFDLVSESRGGPLFRLMQRGGRDKKLSHHYTEHFTQYRRKIGLYRPLMDFHAFRTTATTTMLRSKRVTILEVDEITGHDSAQRKERKETQTTTLNYFRGFGPKLLRDAVETIEYPSIDLSRHLRA